MFYGIEVKSSQNQAKNVTLENPIKLTQAVLEPGKNGKKEPVSLMVEHDKKPFILCVLDPALSWQCPLDLVFNPGSSLKFFIKGTGTVHLTGYEILDEFDDISMSSMGDDDDDDQDIFDGETSDSDKEDENEKKHANPEEKKIERMVKTSGKKVKEGSKVTTNGVRIPTRRLAGSEQNNLDDEDDEDDSDDSDFDLGDSDDDDEEVDIEEEIEDDDDDDDEELEDEEMDD